MHVVEMIPNGRFLHVFALLISRLAGEREKVVIGLFFSSTLISDTISDTPKPELIFCPLFLSIPDWLLKRVAFVCQIIVPNDLACCYLLIPWARNVVFCLFLYHYELLPLLHNPIGPVLNTNLGIPFTSTRELLLIEMFLCSKPCRNFGTSLTLTTEGGKGDILTPSDR